MTVALFGKLPAKRDFVSRHVPTGFSGVVEPWLHEGLAISRHVLGAQWQEAYLAAPIWRFWLPPGLTKCGIMGAMMPSVDGIGRFFPLVILTVAPEGGGFAHPSYDPHAQWFDPVEGILLGALEEDVTLDTVLTWLGRVREPAPADPQFLVAPEDRNRPKEGVQRPLGPGLHRLRRAAPPPYTATAWWTTGGQDYPPTALAWDAMPETSFFREMLVPAAAPTPPPPSPAPSPSSAPSPSPAPSPNPAPDAQGFGASTDAAAPSPASPGGPT